MVWSVEMQGIFRLFVMGNDRGVGIGGGWEVLAEGEPVVFCVWV